MAVTLIAGLASGIGTWAAGLTIFGLTGGAAFFAAFAIGAGLSLVSRALAPKLDTGSQMGGRSVTTREAAQSRKIVYGRARIGGNIVYLESTGTDNKYLWLVIAVAGHEIDAYESVWFNDKKIWDGGSYVGSWGSYVDIGFYKGDQTTADNSSQRGSASLVSNSSKWTDNHKLLDTAYMVVKLTYDADQFAQGLPNISTIIRGKKVLDPSDSSTAWSDNPALCVYDYLRDTKYGLGETVANILTASITTAKGICDEPVDLADDTTQARYTINGVLDTGSSIKNNIEQMLGSMIGRLVYSGGQFEIHAGKYVAPAFTVDESVAVGEITVQTKQSRRSAYNGVKGVFLSEDDNYILADYPAQLSTSYATADGDPIYLDMALPFTTNNIRAQRIAKLALFRSRQQESITIPCNLSALRFKVGENINVTNTRLGYSNKIFEVVGYSMAFSSDGQIVVNVDAIETASSIWDWSTTDEEVFLGGGEVDLYDGTVAVAPTSINVTSDSFLSDDGTFNSQFNVAWTNADDAFTDHYVVEWKLASASDYFSQTTKSTPFSIVNLVNNASYNVRVKAVNEIGVSSAYLSATETSAIDTTAPSAPTSVSAKDEFEQATVSWVNPTVDDFSHVDVYGSNSSGSGFALIGKSAGTTFTEPELGTGVTRYYKLKAVDYTGNASVYSSVDSATTTQVPIGGIADDAVDTDQIADLAVDTGQLDNDAVTIAKIAASLQSTNYVSGSAGWKIQKSGVVEFEEATIRGNISATTGSIGGINVSTDKIYVGTGTFNNANTAFYADDGGQFSLKDKLSWNGTALNIDGGGTFSGALSAASGTFTGELSGGTISIGSSNAIFKADSNGIYLGNATFGSAPFRVTTAGALTATSATITGALTLTNVDGTTVEYIGGNLQVGTIGGGNLGASAKFASFFRYTISSGTSVAAPSDSAFTTEFGRAPQENDQLIVNNTATTPDTQAAYVRGSSAWGSAVDNFLSGSLIVDGSIGADQIIANSIGADEIQVVNLAAINANMGTITAGSISSALITGDVTEVYPIGQYYYTALTSSAATLGSFTIPAPTSGILKRQKIDVNVLFKIVNSAQTPTSQAAIVFTVQKKSKGVNAVTVGTVTVETESFAYNQLLSISGNVLDNIDISGGVAASADASGSNEPAYIQAVYYDSGSNKTFIQCSAYTDLFSTGNTLYFSDSKFTSAGTWVTPILAETIYVATPPDPIAGVGSASVYLPFKMSYGQTTTLTDYRVRAHVSNAQSGVTYTAYRMVGTLENIS